MLEVYDGMSGECPGWCWRGGAVLGADAADQPIQWLVTSVHTVGVDSAPLSGVCYIHISCF